MQTPEVAAGTVAPDFELPGIDGRRWSRDAARGPNGLLVMFICNHCPYVQAIRERLVDDVRDIQRLGVGCVAIMPNDTDRYPADSFDNMIKAASQFGFPFPYLLDESQAVARAYGAVCTPDFFGYDGDLALRYRGRLDSAAAREQRGPEDRRELVAAMQAIAEGESVPQPQYPSVGCSIKWR